MEFHSTMVDMEYNLNGLLKVFVLCLIEEDISYTFKSKRASF